MTRTERLLLLSVLSFLAFGAAWRWGRRARPPAVTVVSPSPIERRERSRSAPIDLNRAGRAELESLPGVGPRLAAAIIRRRERFGPFRDASEVAKVRGFGVARYEKLRGRLSVNGRIGGAIARSGHRKASPRVVDLNRAGAEELAALPAIGRKTAERIVLYRKRKGPFREKSDLLRIPEISLSAYRRIARRLVCGPPESSP